MATQTPRARAPRQPVDPAKPAKPAKSRQSASSAAGHGAADPDGGRGEIHDQLVSAVAETARLLEADGAMVYLLDPETGHLRFAHDAGIRSPRSREWVRSLVLPIGVGMFGRAVAERGVVGTDDYLADPTIAHAKDPDRIVADIGIRSMVAAPLISGSTIYGALGAFSGRKAAFSASQVALVRALADHAAAAMANARLIDALDQSRVELAKRADVERSLREIAARISAASDLPAVLQSAVDEAARLLRADGARIDLIDLGSGLLRWAYASGAQRPDDESWPDDPDETLDQGVSGQAVVNGRVTWTGDYLHDDRFPHGLGADTYIRGTGIMSVMAAPLIGETGPFGAVTIYTGTPDAWTDQDAALLLAIADQAAITITTTRLIGELDRSREALGRRAEAEQALREIAARITVMREPDEILHDVVGQAVRLVRADGAILDLLDPATGNLHWAYDDGLGDGFSDEERAKLWISVGVGATGTAVAEDRVIVAGDDLASLFPPSPESTEFYERTGFHSMIAAPITGDAGPLGVLEVYSTRRDAFTETDGSLIGALASQAAIAITNARLIDELASSREALAHTAEAERTLREIAARVSAMRDKDEILQSVIDASVRLLGATGAMIDLLGEAAMAEAWTTQEAGQRAVANMPLLEEVELQPDAGVSGLALRTRRVEWTGDYLGDDRFEHTPGRDAFVRESAIRSVIAAPLIHRDVAVGAITVYGDRADAFDEHDAALLAALADQAAVAIANANLIDELERSRAEVARRADSERTLREIAARVSAILDPAEVLQRIVEEAARLLDSDGARIDQYDPEIGALRWSYAAGDAMSVVPDWAQSGGLKPGQAVAGRAFSEQQPILTRDYLADERFDHQPEIDAFIRDMGIRAVMSTPLSAEAGPIGTISVVSRQPGAYDAADLEVLTALATQASIAIRNARLMDELARSRAVIERRAEAEHALREIATRITAIREPTDLLQRIVDEAFRLLRADGAVIDEFDPVEGVLVTAYHAGLTLDQQQAVATSRLHLGEGLAGRAMLEGRVLAAGDYLQGDFEHIPASDALAADTGIGDLIVAPIIGDEGPLGAIEVYKRARYAFDAIDEAVLGGLADQAAIAITNARLIEELERSRQAIERRADTERSLRDITASIAALREPELILERVVDEAKRLLGTDAAHLTRMSEDGSYLIPVVIQGGSDVTERWLLGMEFPLGGGINGLAAMERTPVATEDYLLDDRIPQEPEDVEVAERLGLRGMAAAPLRAPGGDVIGTLAVSSRTPRAFQPEELDLLQGLADQAAIAITNSTLLTRLSESEERYRYLIENAPDLVWSIGADSRLTFLSDAVERMTGRRAEDLLGQHFGVLVHETSRDVAELDWTAGLAESGQELRGRVNLLGRDGEAIPAEFIATARLDERGEFAGANGSVRDMRERDRLERELRESETRFRQLVQTSPDVIYRCDADGRFLFVAEGAEALFGWTAAEVVGMGFADLTAPGSLEEAIANFGEQHEEHDVIRRFRYLLKHRGGSEFPAEISSVSVWEDGVFAGVQGTVRDVSEQERLERELHESEERYRFLVENSPDVVFATDPDGQFTFLSEAIERMIGFGPRELTGRHFSTVIEPASMATAADRWAKLTADPSSQQVAELVLMGVDGRRTPVEVHSIGIIRDDGSFGGIHGATRDISERERLQRELRTSEERYRYLVSSSPDLVWVTDATGRLTFASEAAEGMLGVPASELIGRQYWEVFADGARREAEVRFAWLSRHPTSVHRSRLPFRHADGHDVLVEINGIGMVDEDGRFVGAHGAARDVGERERLERDLRRQAGELAAGEERAHLARELHDSVTQALFSMTLVSRSVELLLDRDAEAARAQLTQLRELQREALAEMRALIFELRPGNLEQDGLTRALKTHTAALQGRIGLPVVVESEVDERLPLAVEEALYRIAQEALHNVVKHAAAQQVRVTVGRVKGGIRLRIHDDGKGFDPRQVPAGHLGLAGMQARAARIGATFTCRSEPGKGTTIDVVVPDAVTVAAGSDPAVRRGPTPDPSIRDR